MDETLPSYITSMVEVEGGYDFTCARKSDGTVYCWGSDQQGQLGTGSFGFDRSVATKVVDLTDASDLCVGYQHACAVKSDGKMFCWGKGTDDRLGFGTTENQFSPVEVKNISNAVSCSLGTSHTCVELSDKTTRCWGNAASGQLGNGQLSTTKMTIPVSVYGISNAAQISAGGSHACAVLDNGSIACWGSGLNGELGIKLVGSKSTPVIVPVSGTFTQVSAGYDHTCALKNDGTVWCFGDNGNGQLGDNSTTDSFTAVQVSNITNAKQISVGSDFSCVLLNDNKTKCWGRNDSGQLGNGNTTTSLIPVNVRDNSNLISNVKHLSTGTSTSCVTFNDNSSLMRILMAEDPTRNPKKNIYIEPKESLLDDIDKRSGFPGVSTSDRYHDPFGNPYIVSLDYDGDGNCTDALYGQDDVTENAAIGLVESINPNSRYVLKGRAVGKVMIWTFGPDKSSSVGGAMDGDNADNILSWR